MTTLEADARRVDARAAGRPRRLERRSSASCGRVIIVFLLLITIFPFYYMVVLSFRPLDAVLQDPGRAVARARRDRLRHLPRRARLDRATAGRASSPS